MQVSSTSTHQENDLVQLLKQRDKKGFSMLYEKYSSALFGVILKVVKTEEIASDVLQESFVKIWKKIDTYDKEKGTLFTWILNISRNTAIDKIRSAAYRHQNQAEDIDNASLKVQENVHIQTDHIGLDNIVAKLRPEYRQVIDTIYFEGYTHVEAAEKLGLPLGTLKTRVKAALKELRKLT